MTAPGQTEQSFLFLVSLLKDENGNARKRRMRSFEQDTEATEGFFSVLSAPPVRDFSFCFLPSFAILQTPSCILALFALHGRVS